MITDFHSHILPGIDDGSRSTAESLQLLRTEAEQGIRRVIATPHFYANHDDPERFLARRAASEARLREAMADRTDLPQVITGAEVHFFHGMSDSAILTQLTIGQKGCILIEMPPAPWTPQMYRELEWIYAKQDLIPVIAHVDRYIRPLRTYGIDRRLEELPVRVQANASFFLHAGTAAFAMKLLRQDRIQLLGSDCHNLTDRAPNLEGALQRIKRKLGAEALERIRENERQLLG
jgi:protein-tyrosine phosphatase